MEVIDLYDRNKRKLNKTFIRGKDRLSAGEYYLLEQVWIVNKDNEILLTQRNENKSYGGFWEPTTGHVKTKESDVSGALRELKEELGVVVGSEDLVTDTFPTSILFTVSSTIFVILLAASLTVWAKDLISLATTAKPLPCSPALASTTARPLSRSIS